MPTERVMLVMPAYNEAEGLPVFLAETLAALRGVAADVDVLVMDDGSTDGTADAVTSLGDPCVRVVSAPVNRGHGPTVLAAYARALASTPGAVIHVDGDGQFRGADVARVAAALQSTGADVVHGVRRHRTDPWYRRILSAGLRGVALVVARRSVPDLNTPLRAYRPDALAWLLSVTPAEALVPHVHFSIAEARAGLRVRYVPVRSLPRRGGDAQGTSWGGGPRRRMLPPQRLVRFVTRASAELVRATLAAGSPDGRPGARLP